LNVRTTARFTAADSAVDSSADDSSADGATDPDTGGPPTDCTERSYCDCSSGCEPLVDLSTGCICNCQAIAGHAGEVAKRAI